VTSPSRGRPGSRKVLRAALANPALRFLQAASISWSAADAAYLVGLLVLAYDESGAAGVAVANVVRTVPSVAIAPLVSIASHRIRHDVALRLLLALRLVAVATGGAAVAIGLPLAAVLVAVAIDSVAGSLLRPTRSALLPMVARTPDELVLGNVATTTGESVANLVGPAAAAAALTVSGPAATFAVAVVLAIVAFVAAASVRVVSIELPTTSGDDERSDAPAVPAAVAGGGGLRGLGGVLVATFVAQRFVRGMFTVLLVVAVLEQLAMGEAGVGVATAAVGAGGLVGGVLSVGLVGRRLSRALAAGLAAWGASIALPGLAPIVPSVLAGFAVGGAGKLAFDVASFSLLQRTLSNRERGRVFAVMEGLVTAALAAGGVAATVLIDAIGAGPALAAVGAGVVVLAALAGLGLHLLPQPTESREHELELLRGVPMFAPLALALTEELATTLRRSSVDAGTVVIRQGDVGDAFYIVDHGRCEATVAGEVVRSLGPGDSFGEIALVRDVPRTSTVRAVEPTTLLIVDGATFRAVVSGHGASSVAAESVVRARLSTTGI